MTKMSSGHANTRYDARGDTCSNDYAETEHVCYGRHGRGTERDTEMSFGVLMRVGEDGGGYVAFVSGRRISAE